MQRIGRLKMASGGIVLHALRSLSQTRLRTALTVSGITIGIASLFSLMSIAEGIRTRVVHEWLSSGLMTSLSVTPQGVQRLFRPGAPRRGPRASRPSRTAEAGRTLDGAAAAEIARLPGIRRVWPVISRPVEIVADVQRSERGGPLTPDHRTGSGPGAARAPSSAAPGPSADKDPGPTTGPHGGADSTKEALAGAPAERGTESARAGSRDTSLAVEAPADKDAGPATESTTLRGLDTDFFWAEDYIKITAGTPLTDPTLFQALLSEGRVKSLGFKDAGSAVGRTIAVRWRQAVPTGTAGAEKVQGVPFSLAMRTTEFRVVGVFENRGALSLRAAGIIVPTGCAEKIETLDPEQIRSLFMGGPARGGYPGLDVYLTPGADLEAVETKIKEMGFETLSGAEIVSRIRRSILVLQALLGGIGSIAIAVATLGIANTLLTAVYERMREIGVMKAVGARRRDIRRQFFAEAGLMGSAGGVIGILVGFGGDHLLSFVIGQIVRRQGGEEPGSIAVHTPTIALGCLVFSIALSLLAGTYPAARAARLDPVVALRHE